MLAGYLYPRTLSTVSGRLGISTRRGSPRSPSEDNCAKMREGWTAPWTGFTRLWRVCEKTSKCALPRMRWPSLPPCEPFWRVRASSCPRCSTLRRWWRTCSSPAGNRGSPSPKTSGYVAPHPHVRRASYPGSRRRSSPLRTPSPPRVASYSRLQHGLRTSAAWVDGGVAALWRSWPRCCSWPVCRGRRGPWSAQATANPPYPEQWRRRMSLPGTRWRPRARLQDRSDGVRCPTSRAVASKRPSASSPAPVSRWLESRPGRARQTRRRPSGPSPHPEPPQNQARP